MASVARSPKELFWERQSESLGKIRDQLVQNGRRPPPKMAGRGRYSRTPPAQLPRLNTPPDHERLKKKSNLRRGRYDIVPPLAAQDSHEDSGNDSWGEEADSDEERPAHHHRSNPYPTYQYPGNPYPMVPYPGASYAYPGMGGPALVPVMFAPPPPAHQSYNSPQSHRRAKPGQTSRQPNKKVHYRNTPVVLGGGTPHSDSPSFQYIKKRHNEYDVFDPGQNPVLARYQVPVNRSPESRRRHLLLEAESEFIQGSLFARVFVDDFIRDELEEELIPDILIDMLSQPSHMKKDVSLYRASEDTRDEIFNKTVNTMLREVVLETLTEMTDQYLRGQVSSRDPLMEWLNELVDDVVHEGVVDVVRDTVDDVVDTHLQRGAMYDIIMELATEQIVQDGPEIVMEAMLDVVLDEVIEEEYLIPEVEEESREVAIEVLQHYDDKVKKRDLREIHRHAGSKTIDAVCLDYLLSMIARQGHIYTEGEHANRLLDGLMLEIVLQQMDQVKICKSTTIENLSVRRHHEKAFTDMALDVLLEELGQTLDEDMLDLDEYEQGFGPPQHPSGLHQLSHWLEGK